MFVRSYDGHYKESLHKVYRRRFSKELIGSLEFSFISILLVVALNLRMEVIKKRTDMNEWWGDGAFPSNTLVGTWMASHFHYWID